MEDHWEFLKSALLKYRNKVTKVCPHCSHKEVTSDNGKPRFVVVSDKIYREIEEFMIRGRDYPHLNTCEAVGLTDFTIDGVTVVKESSVCFAKEEL